MSSSPKTGKLFVLLLLISLICSLGFDGAALENCAPDDQQQQPPNHDDIHDPNTNTNTTEYEYDMTSLYKHHQAQIHKLEHLLHNLTDLVARLESKFQDSKPQPQPQLTNLNSFDNKPTHNKDKDEDDVDKLKDVVGGKTGSRIGKDVGEGKRFKMGSVTKYSPFWSEKFQFMSAVNLDSIATTVNLLPFRDYEGFTKYIAVGDDRGRVYVFLRNGDALLEFYTLSHSPVTCMLSYMSASMNESMLVTGHSNGVILVHRLWETSPVGGDHDLSPLLHIEQLSVLDTQDIESNEFPISVLEVHYVRRSKYILAVDEIGRIQVFRENGTFYGLAVPTSRPLVFLKQRLMFLMQRGAGSLDLRTMKIRETDCEGLNESLVKNYVFDANERSKAYGFTSSGDLIHILLLGDVMNFKCRVRSRKKFDMEDQPLAFQAIKGYLLIVGQSNVYVYNVSTQHYTRSGVPRLTFSAVIDEIKASFLPNQMVDEGSQTGKAIIPLIASDQEKLVILGLGGGCVGMYQSKLPVFKGESSSTMLWTSPVLFFILFLFGAWQFFAKKKDELTSWGPDDPFKSTSVTSSGAPLVGDRAFSDSAAATSRNDEIMDLTRRGGPPRRYSSPPSRYPAGGGGGGGGATSFRPGGVDAASARPPSSIDPNYRATTTSTTSTTAELKFRGSNLDSTGFPKRRDNMFGNNQVVDDGN